VIIVVFLQCFNTVVSEMPYTVSSGTLNGSHVYVCLLQWGRDFYKEHERFLVQYCANGVPVFITDFPADIKPFYARRNDDGRTVSL